jgi:hypothetical protein
VVHMVPFIIHIVDPMKLAGFVRLHTVVWILTQFLCLQQLSA